MKSYVRVTDDLGNGRKLITHFTPGGYVVITILKFLLFLLVIWPVELAFWAIFFIVKYTLIAIYYVLKGILIALAFPFKLLFGRKKDDDY